MIKDQDCFSANFGGEDRLVLTAPADIAYTVVDEITSSRPTDNSICYVASDEMTCDEAARILGTAISKPYLKWETLTNQQMQKGLESYGMSSDLAASLVEMQAVIHQGLMTQEFSLHKSETATGKVKIPDFAEEFAEVYHNH